jgi:hypothetical protein
VAFVPAWRALTWQTTDDAGTPVVRQRSCHGTNTANQAGLAAPVDKPRTVRELLNYWKTLPR